MAKDQSVGTYRIGPCPECGEEIPYFIELLGILGHCPHCREKVSHRV